MKKPSGRYTHPLKEQFDIFDHTNGGHTNWYLSEIILIYLSRVKTIMTVITSTCGLQNLCKKADYNNDASIDCLAPKPLIVPIANSWWQCNNGSIGTIDNAPGFARVVGNASTILHLIKDTDVGFVVASVACLLHEGLAFVLLYYIVGVRLVWQNVAASAGMLYKLHADLWMCQLHCEISNIHSQLTVLMFIIAITKIICSFD